MGDSDDEPKVEQRGALLRVRRSVKFRAFLLTGVLLGLFAGGIVAAVGAQLIPHGGAGVEASMQNATYSLGTVVAFFAALGGVAGGIVAAAVALMLDRRGWRSRLDRRG